MPSLNKQVLSGELPMSLDPEVIAGLDPEMKQLLKEELEETIRARAEQRRGAKKRAEANKRAGIELAAAFGRNQKIKQARCNHQKPRNLGTRVVATRIDMPNGSTVLFSCCQGCQKEWFDPPAKGQEPLPREIATMIDPDEIGG